MYTSLFAILFKALGNPLGLELAKAADVYGDPGQAGPKPGGYWVKGEQGTGAEGVSVVMPAAVNRP